MQVLTKGKGPIGQLGLPLGLPLNPELAGFGLAVWVGFFLVAGMDNCLGFVWCYGETCLRCDGKTCTEQNHILLTMFR